MDCLFCNIVNKQIDANIIYEDDYVVAFHDIHPVAPVHVLVIPKVHISNINEISSNNSGNIEKVFLAMPKIAKICGVDKSGYRVICNTGEDGGQEVFHIHFHLLGGKKLGTKLVKD